MKILIISKADGSLASSYDADAPNQGAYGGPWGNSNQFAHMECPEDVDSDCVHSELVDGEIEISEDSDKLQAKRDAKLDQLRAMRDARLLEVDIMINELVVGDRSDTAAVKTYRQALLDITSDYKKVDGHAKAMVDNEDWNVDVTWPTKP